MFDIFYCNMKKWIIIRVTTLAYYKYYYIIIILLYYYIYYIYYIYILYYIIIYIIISITTIVKIVKHRLQLRIKSHIQFFNLNNTVSHLNHHFLRKGKSGILFLPVSSQTLKLKYTLRINKEISC